MSLVPSPVQRHAKAMPIKLGWLQIKFRVGLTLNPKPSLRKKIRLHMTYVLAAAGDEHGHIVPGIVTTAV